MASTLTLAVQATGLAFGLMASFVLSFEAVPRLRRAAMRIPHNRRLYAGYFALGWRGREHRERLVIPDLYPGRVDAASPPIEYDTWRLKQSDPGFFELYMVLLGTVGHLRSLGLDTRELPRPDEILHVRRPIAIVISSMPFADEGIYFVYTAVTTAPQYLRLNYDFETLGAMVEHEEKAYLTRLGLVLLSVSVFLQAFALVA